MDRRMIEADGETVAALAALAEGDGATLEDTVEMIIGKADADRCVRTASEAVREQD